MRITVFYPASIQFYPGIEDEQGLGTSERAVIEFAEKAQAEGHAVEVHAQLRDGDYYREGVWYEEVRTMKVGDVIDCDVLICYRTTFVPQTTAKRIVLWSMDDTQTPAMKDLAKEWQRFEAIIVLSDYHKKRFMQAGVDEQRIVIVPPGVDDEHIPKEQKMTMEPYFIYASAPYKGLPMLASMWPTIHEKTGMKLKVYSSMAMHGSDDDFFINLFRALKNMPGVELHGTIPQRELLFEMQQATAMLMPSTYPETYCNSAAESIAMGTPVITNDLGALKTTVRDAGIVIPSHPLDKDFRDSYVAAVEEFLRRKWPYTYQAQAHLAYTWNDMTKDIIKVIQ